MNESDTSEIATVEILGGESYSFTMPALDVTITVELEDTEVLYAYFEDFEDTDGGFTSGGTGNLWQWGTPISWPSAAYSGDKCWGTNLTGSYLNNSNSYLNSPIIQLTGVTLGSDLRISWRQAWQLESNVWDNATAEYSVNDGPWIGMWNNSSGTITQGWTELGYTLNDYNGEEIQIKWRLWTDSSITYAGVYVDDVTIEEIID